MATRGAFRLGNAGNAGMGAGLGIAAIAGAVRAKQMWNESKGNTKANYYGPTHHRISDAEIAAYLRAKNAQNRPATRPNSPPPKKTNLIAQRLANMRLAKNRREQRARERDALMHAIENRKRAAAARARVNALSRRKSVSPAPSIASLSGNSAKSRSARSNNSVNLR